MFSDSTARWAFMPAREYSKVMDSRALTAQLVTPAREASRAVHWQTRDENRSGPEYT